MYIFNIHVYYVYFGNVIGIILLTVNRKHKSFAEKSFSDEFRAEYFKMAPLFFF